MPIYVYERADGSRFEMRQGFNDPHLSEDPETGVPVRRVVLAPPVIFKGSGWYKTDSRATTNNASATSEPIKTEGSAESTPAKEPTAKTEGAAPAETKPAAKAEAKTETPRTSEKSSPAAAH